VRHTFNVKGTTPNRRKAVQGILAWRLGQMNSFDPDDDAHRMQLTSSALIGSSASGHLGKRLSMGRELLPYPTNRVRSGSSDRDIQKTSSRLRPKRQHQIWTAGAFLIGVIERRGTWPRRQESAAQTTADLRNGHVPNDMFTTTEMIPRCPLWD